MNKPLHSLVKEEPARFDVSEFSAIARVGAFDFTDDRIELVDGVITRMPPALMPHVALANDLTFALRTALGAVGSELTVYADAGLRIDFDTVRQPDIMIFRRREGPDYAEPADVLVAIEVADSTLALDLGPRRERFARAGIPHYWVVDIEAERTHVFGEPDGDDYATHDEHGFDAELPIPGTDRTIRLRG